MPPRTRERAPSADGAPPAPPAPGGGPREPQGWPSPRATRLLVAGLVALAFLVRLVYVLQSRANPFFAQPVMDPLYHVEWARAFAHGERFRPGPFFRAPLYPWFLGILFRLFGPGLLLPRIVQCALGAATTGLTYLVGRRAFDRRVGLLAGLGVATYWVLVYFDGELLIPALAIPLDLLALWLTLRLSDRPGRRAALACGAAWGLAAIARPNVLLLMPVLFFWLLARLWSTRREALLSALALTAGTLVPILPITAYNAAQGDAVLIATQAGVNFWIGNNPEHARNHDVSTAIVPGTRAGWWEGFEDARAQAVAGAGKPLSDSAISRWYASKAWHWISSHPGDALAHTLRKLRMFWNAAELGNNQPVRGFAYRFGPITRWLPLGFAVLAPLGLLGLVLVLVGRAGRARLLPLWGFLLVYTASVVVFFVNSRYRAPVLPVLAVLGAHACLWLLAELRARRWVPLGVAVAALLSAGLFVRRVPAIYRVDAATTYKQLATAADADGKPEEALAYLEKALAGDPGLVEARLQQASVLRELGRLDAAEAAARQALAVQPAHRETLQFLADLLLSQRGRVADGLAVARELVQRYPSFPEGHYLLGRALFGTGKVPEAEAQFRAGLALRPDDYSCAFGLGQALGNQGRFGEAVEPFRTAYTSAEAALAQGKPTEAESREYWSAALQLAAVLARAGRKADLELFLSELEAKHRGDPRLDQLRRNLPR